MTDAEADAYSRLAECTQRQRHRLGKTRFRAELARAPTATSPWRTCRATEPPSRMATSTQPALIAEFYPNVEVRGDLGEHDTSSR